MSIQLFEYHPIIGYRFIPGLKLRLEHEGGGYLVRTNDAGFRSEHEYAKAKTPLNKGGKFRILLFGDSFTAGDAVSNKHRYGDVLETLIPDLEVYNFALPGTGTDQHYLVWREIAKEFEHDLVVIAAQVENIRRVAAHHRVSITSEGDEVLLAKPYFELANGELVLKNVPVPKEPLRQDELSEEDKAFVDQGGRMPWLRNIVNKLGVKDLAQKMSGYQPLPEYDSPDGREWQLMSAILKQWIDELERPVILIPIPLYQYVEETASPENYRARFREFATEDTEAAELKNSENADSVHSVNSVSSVAKSFILHDPLDDYYAVPKAERRGFRFEKDIHPTPAHHQLLAKSLAKCLYRFFPTKAEGATE